MGTRKIGKEKNSIEYYGTTLKAKGSASICTLSGDLLFVSGTSSIPKYMRAVSTAGLSQV